MRTNKEISSDYFNLAEKVAVIVGQLDDIKTTCKYLMEETKDNGDPYFDLMPAIEHLGVALATMVVYAGEYSNEKE